MEQCTIAFSFATLYHLDTSLATFACVNLFHTPYINVPNRYNMVAIQQIKRYNVHELQRNALQSVVKSLLEMMPRRTTGTNYRIAASEFTTMQGYRLIYVKKINNCHSVTILFMRKKEIAHL